MKRVEGRDKGHRVNSEPGFEVAKLDPEMRFVPRKFLRLACSPTRDPSSRRTERDPLLERTWLHSSSATTTMRMRFRSTLSLAAERRPCPRSPIGSILWRWWSLKCLGISTGVAPVRSENLRLHATCYAVTLLSVALEWSESWVG